jgi:serine protease AprX
LRGLRWVIDTHQRLNIRIVNISVGGDFVSNDPGHPLHKAIRKLTKAGVAVVVAAGNRNIDYLLPPASAAEAITVGGIDDHNVLDESRWTLYHHNYGKAYDGTPKPDILAPAAWLASPIMPGSSVEREAYWLAPLLTKADERHVRKLLKRGHGDLGLTVQTNAQPDEHLYAVLQQRIHAHKLIDAHHQHVDGTSVAAPIVSAVIAQMLEANPRLTPQQIRAILTDTANRLTHAPVEKQGSGIINAKKAVLAALNFA